MKGSSFLRIGVTCANFNCEGKVSLLSIVFAILHIGIVNYEVAALVIFGGIESTPVVFWNEVFLCKSILAFQL